METGIINKETWSLVLAIGVCYHAKMEKRSDFEKYIYKHFCSPLTEVTQTEIQEIIKKLVKFMDALYSDVFVN